MSSRRTIVSNITGLTTYAPDDVGVYIMRCGDRERAWKRLRRLARAEAAVISNPGKRTALQCALAQAMPRGPRVLYYDVLVPMAETFWSRLMRGVHLRLVGRADLILTVHADTSGYEHLFQLGRNRFRYIGFKSNSWEDKDSIRIGAQSRDSGTYVLACGRSYRDFATFTAAMLDAGLPAKILVPGGEDAARHGTVLPTGSLPDNVELVPHDGSRASWLNAILGAKIVAVPLRANVVQPAGVSVYLEAMNLSRAVIVTEGPSTLDMLDASIAGIVPPEDPKALAREVNLLWFDPSLRASRVACALRYVNELGGIERISRDLLAVALKNAVPSSSATGAERT